MKNLSVLISACLFAGGVMAQQVYCDFEGTKLFSFGQYTGALDSLVANPTIVDPNNMSANCAMYIRDSATQYDFIKVNTMAKMMDVTPYASNTFQAPKIKMRVYSTAPIGTIVQLQLGTRAVDNYPAGVHSEYMAATTVQNGWEQLTFNFYQIPSGSLTQPTDCDKMVILYYPGAYSNDTMYFDDIIGPQLVSSNVHETNGQPFRLFQNHPNPATGSTTISFQLGTAGSVSLKMFDLLGNPVNTVVEQNLRPGLYNFPVETAEIPVGIYFYVLKVDDISQTMKMTITR